MEEENSENQNWENENWEEDNCTPPEVRDGARAVSMNLLPLKSKAIYEKAYNRFQKFLERKNVRNITENVVLAYMAELEVSLKSKTLWSHYSMLKATISLKHNIDLSKFLKLRAFLKQKSSGYIPKKSKTLTKQEFQGVLKAPNEKYLMHKVALIFGISGACRREELAHLTIDNIEDLGTVLLIKIPDNKTNKPRSFTVTGHYVDYYRQYALLRPTNCNDRRFFYSYRNGKCTRQVVGIHKFGAIPQEIATYLKLDNPKDYTGHCFRRTSATLLVDAGANLTALKRHGGWRSSSVAEGYIDDSLTNKVDVSNKILNTNSNTPCMSDTPHTSDTACLDSVTVEKPNDVLVEEAAIASSVKEAAFAASSTKTSKIDLKSRPIIIQNCKTAPLIFNTASN